MTDTPIHFAVGDAVIIRTVRWIRSEEEARRTAEEHPATVAAVTENGRECYLTHDGAPFSPHSERPHRFDTLTGRCVSPHPWAYMAIRKAGEQ